MATLKRRHVEDLRGASRLLIDASAGVVDVVERMHRTIQRTPWPLGRPVEEPTSGITGFVYRNVRGTMRLVERGLDLSLAPIAGLLPEGESTAGRDVFVSVVNGVYGDHLARTGNPLEVGMTLRRGGIAIDPANPSASLAAAGQVRVGTKILVLVHGLCMSDHQWLREGHGHGSALADEFDYVPLYLRYNSGLSVAENGRRFAALLETLVANWPQPPTELAIVAHSMGGLVARSAVHAAAGLGHAWPGTLRRLVFLGTPHHGAPLERGGHGLDLLLAISPYSAPFTRIGQQRSAGIKDLRHGAVTADPKETVPLPESVASYAIAATLANRRSTLADRLVGDGLVPLDSALGRHRGRHRTLQIPKSRQWVAYETGHLELLHRAEVYVQLRNWFGEPALPHGHGD